MRDRPYRRQALVALLAALAVGVPSARAAQEAAETVSLRGPVADDLYVAGGTVDLQVEAGGDLVAAGGRVTVGRLVKADLLAAGGTVAVTGEVGDDARVAGGTVTIDARVAGDLLAAGGRVSLVPGAAVAGRAWLAGADVEVSGTVGRELRVAARTVRLSGLVRGNVRLTAEEVELLPTARIEGSLAYWSPNEARVDPGARVAGEMVHHPSNLAAGADRASRVGARVVRVAAFLGALVAGTVLVLLFPGFTAAAATIVGRKPLTSLALGFALLVATPVAALLLVLTVVGLPIGLALLAFYLVSIPVGGLVTAFFLGDAGAGLLRVGPLGGGARLLWFFVALAALWLVRLIPVAGGVILFLALLSGLGAAALALQSAYTGAATPARVD